MTTPSPAKANLARLQSAMLIASITEIVVSFSGYGDSGQVEDIQFVGGVKEIQAQKIPWLKEVRSFNPNLPGWTTEIQPVEISIADAAEALAMDLADASGVDWYNNDGGNGEIIITPNHLEGFINQNVVEIHEAWTINTLEDPEAEEFDA